jgi:hypothetical protein
MECAAEPVLVDAIFCDDLSQELRRTQVPDANRIAVDCLADLQPIRVQFLPSISIASYRKTLRADIDRRTETIAEKDGNWRRIEMEEELRSPRQIGQLLGYANSHDEQENLYRQVYLARIDKRSLTYNDYWDSIEEYEAYKAEWRDLGNHSLVKQYEAMREGVTWLIDNREAIARGAAEWNLLLRIDSNAPMGLNMMDGDPLYVFIRDNDLKSRKFSNLAGEVTQG